MALPAMPFVHVWIRSVLPFFSTTCGAKLDVMIVGKGRPDAVYRLYYRNPGVNFIKL